MASNAYGCSPFALIPNCKQVKILNDSITQIIGDRLMINYIFGVNREPSAPCDIMVRNKLV